MAVGIPIAALLFRAKVIDPYVAIPATFWLGSLLGGLIFGFGMVFAGGCAGRAVADGRRSPEAVGGDGLLRLGRLDRRRDLQEDRPHRDRRDQSRDLGDDRHRPSGLPPPDMLGGWGLALLIGFGLLALWYAIVRWNETTEKLTVL